MRTTTIFLFHSTLVMFCHAKSNFLSAASPRVDLNFTELVKFDGYESEWHHVITDDGYVLSLFRVRTRGPCGNITEKISKDEGNRARDVERVPILFAHGMYLSGDDCVTPGPNNAHCYLYADACHDVWVYNARGSRYSRKHVTLNPDKDAQYWDFAFDDMALHDLPATIDYILDQTKNKQIAYIGHSQGSAILMLLCAEKPEFNDKIKVGFGLSPIATLSHARFAVVDIQKSLSDFLPGMDRTGIQYEVFGYGSINQRISRFLCSRKSFSYRFCSELYFLFLGYNGYDITREVLPVFYGHLPSGTSAKNFLRWGQIARNGFSAYDYGEEENLKKYGDIKPPLFDLSKVTMKWVLMCSTNDYISDLRDVNAVVDQLPNVQKCVLSDHRVGHLDFIFGRSVVKYIVPMILSLLERNKYLCL